MQSQSDEHLKKIDKIVLSGGGLRGCVHIGVIKYLEEKHIIQQIKCVAGTSIGSLVGLLVTLSYTSGELEQTIKNFDYTEYNSVDVCHLFEHFGIDTFEKIMEFIATLFIKKKYAPYITFIDLYNQTNKHLIVNSVCLNTHENTLFDYQLTPNMPVITAIRASMTLPFVFGSVKYNGLTYVDGGVLDNFLIHLPIFKDHPETVLGVNLHNSLGFSVKEIITMDQYVINLFSCLYNAYINLATDVSPYPHIIHIITPKFDTFNFLLTNDDKQALIELGYRKVSEHFTAYICHSENKTSSPEVETLIENKNSSMENKNSLLEVKKLIENKKFDDALHIIDEMTK
jgi:NTE family protein